MADGGSVLSGAASGAAAGSTFGPWGTVIGTGVGAVGSLMGASKSSKAQQDAMSQQQQMAQQDLAFRQGMYNRYLGLMGPIEQQLAQEAQSTQPLDYEQNQAQIKEQYANALRNISTNMGMRGIAGSGLDVGAMRGAALGQAGALSNAYAQGLINRRNLGMALTGRNQIMQAGAQVPGGFQGLSNMYGNWGQQYGQAAAQGWQNFGQNLGNLGYALQSMNQPEKVIYGGWRDPTGAGYPTIPNN
jgi:gas vesicle protein